MQDSNSAKMSVLDKIIEMMTGHQLAGLKKKGAAPAVVEMDVHAHDADATPETKDGEADPEGDESPDLLHKLVDMYGKDDDDENDKPKLA